MQQLQKLHELAESLDKGERRFLSLMLSSRIRENGQLQTLLALLYAHPASDAENLNADPRLRSLKSNLPTLCDRLNRLIFEALGLQRAGKTTEGKLSRALERIRILFHRQLWDQAEWELRKAKRLAKKQSRLHQLGLLIHLERELVLARFPNSAREKIMELREEELAVGKYLELQNTLQHLSFQARERMRRRLQIGEGAEQDEFDRIKDHPAVQEGLQSSDFRSFMYASNILGAYYNGIGDYAAAAKIYGTAFVKWKSNPKWIRDDPSSFISIFTNYQIPLLQDRKKHALLDAHLQFIRATAFRSKSIQMDLEKCYYQSRLIILMNTGHLREGLELAAEVEDWIKRNTGRLSTNIRLSFLHNVALIFFLTGEFRSALRLVQRILDMPQRAARVDIREFARLLRLVLNYELGEFELAEYQLQAAYAYFSKQQGHAFALMNLRYLRKLLADPPADERQQIYRAYRQALRGFPPSGGPLGIMEMRIWARAKAEEKSLEEAFALFREG